LHFARLKLEIEVHVTLSLTPYLAMTWKRSPPSSESQELRQLEVGWPPQIALKSEQLVMEPFAGPEQWNSLLAKTCRMSTETKRRAWERRASEGGQ